MTWIIATIITTVLWGSYSIFGERATSIHGEKVSFVFEIIGMIIIACAVFGTLGGFSDFKKMTSASAMNAIIMGLMVSAGTFTLLYAMRTATSINQFPLIIIIAGFYPIINAILAHFFLGSRLSAIQWIGVALAGVALLLVNWTK